MGRRLKPDDLKRAQGNPGKRALPPKAEAADAEVRTAFTQFPAPTYLSVDEKLIWEREIDRIGNLSLLKNSDLSAFEAYVGAVYRYGQAKKIIDAEGMTYAVESKHGTYKRVRPEVAIEKDCRKMMRDFQKEFGMTSVSRISAHSVVAGTRGDQPQLPLVGGGSEPVPVKKDLPLGALRTAGSA